MNWVKQPLDKEITNLENKAWKNLANGTDFNNITSPGAYSVYTNLNQPGGSSTAGVWGVTVYTNESGTVVKQIAVSLADTLGRTWQRTYSSNTWSSWVTLYDSIANINNPATLSPSSLDNFKSLLLTAIGTMSNKEVRDYIVVPSAAIDIFKGVTWRLMVTRGGSALYFSAIAYSYYEDPIQVQYRNGSWEFTDLASIIYGNEIILDIDVSSIRDGYEDFTAPTTPTGYSFAGYLIKTVSYRVLCRGVAGGSRCYYTVTATGTTNVNIILTPVYKK